MRNTIMISLAVAGLILLNELRFIGRTSLAIVLIGLAVALLLQGYVLLQLINQREK